MANRRPRVRNAVTHCGAWLQQLETTTWSTGTLVFLAVACVFGFFLLRNYLRGKRGIGKRGPSEISNSLKETRRDGFGNKPKLEQAQSRRSICRRCLRRFNVHHASEVLRSLLRGFAINLRISAGVGGCCAPTGERLEITSSVGRTKKELKHDCETGVI